MGIVILIIATLLAFSWIALLCLATRQEWLAAAFGKILDNMNEIEKLKLNDARNTAKLSECKGLELAVMKLIYGSSSKKKIAELEKNNKSIQSGDMKTVSLFVIPGYVIQRFVPSILTSSLHRGIMEKYIELYGKKYADKRTNALLAKLVSYPMIGVPAAMLFGSISMSMGKVKNGAIVMGIGIALVCVLVYALYDEVSDRVKKRRDAISRQFPNVVSKLALLVTSGMIMNKAWVETSVSQDGELYIEMRKTADELNNLMDPVQAYSNFIDRCNTKETTKLASAIIQNLSKGNAEIGQLLKNMAHEAWQERRHTAKRDSEAANSKLMIPTMLLFIAILLMIMMPLLSNFTSII